MVTPCVWRSVTLDPIIHCRCSSLQIIPISTIAAHDVISCGCCISFWRSLFFVFLKVPLALKSTRHSSVRRCFMISWSDSSPLSSTSLTTDDSALLSIAPCLSLTFWPETLLSRELATMRQQLRLIRSYLGTFPLHRDAHPGMIAILIRHLAWQYRSRESTQGKRGWLTVKCVVLATPHQMGSNRTPLGSTHEMMSSTTCSSPHIRDGAHSVCF